MVTIEDLDIQESSWSAKITAAAMLLFSASTVLIAGQNAVNRIFGVKATDSAAMSIWRMLFDRLFSFALLVTFAFILSVSMILDASINLIGTYLQGWVGQLSTVVTIVDSALPDLVATALVLVMLFRYLPDVKLRWKDIWFGALLTTLLFGVGRYLIGFLIGQSKIVNLYDVAGSVLVLMAWVYYASAIFLFVATLTSTRANLRDKNVRKPGTGD
jgi:membrane protein